MTASPRAILAVVAVTLSALGALIFGYVYSDWLWGGTSLIIFIVTYGFISAFVSWKLLIPAVLAPIIALFITIPKEFPLILIELAIAAACFLSVWQVRREGALSFETNVARLLRASLPPILTAASLTIALFYYIDERELKSVVLVPRQAVEILLPYFSKMSQGLLPMGDTIDPDDTVDELLERLLAREVADFQGTLKVDNIPASQKKSYLEAEKRALSERLGFPLKGDERIGDVFYEVINKKATEFAGSYIRLWWAALALGLFLGLRTLALPIHWLAVGVNMLLFWLAKRLGLLRVSESTIRVVRYYL